MAIPEGCYGRIAPRSGLAVKNGIHVGASVVDPDYRVRARRLVPPTTLQGKGRESRSGPLRLGSWTSILILVAAMQGEVKVLLFNLGDDDFEAAAGSRVAQVSAVNKP